MSNKRSRDSLSSSALAKDIRNTLEDVSSQHEIESRTKYIKYANPSLVLKNLHTLIIKLELLLTDSSWIV